MKLDGRMLAACVAAVVMAAGGADAQTIVQGPVTNPNNGHRYLVVQGSNWTQLETFAQGLGGHLATVEDALEDAWINTNLTNAGTRKLFLGLSDAAVEGTFVWADGSTAAYRNWRSGQPAPDDFVMTQPSSSGQWDAASATATSFGVVELSGAIKVPGDYATIQAAINAAYPGSTIEVMPGVYNEFLSINKPVVLRSVGGRAVTTLRNDGSSFGIEFDSSAIQSILQGFTIEVGSQGSGFLAAGAASTGRVIDCQFRGTGQFLGAAVMLNNPQGDMRFENCIFSGWNGGGVALISDAANIGGRATLLNCLIAGNSLGGGRVIGVNDGEITMRNCTLAGNSNSPGIDVRGDGTLSLHNCIVREAITNAGTLVATYSNILGGWPGVGNFDADPRFLGGGNYSLLADSPCIDAGDIVQYAGFGGVVDLAGNPRGKNDPNVPNTGNGAPPIDIGAYEFQPLDPNCPADFNGDGFVNGDDYDLFAEHFEEGC